MFQYSANPTPRALVMQLARGDVRHTLAFEGDLTKHEIAGSALVQLQTSVASAAERLTNVAPDLSRNGFNKEAVGQAVHIAPKFGMAIEAGHKAMAALDAEWTRLHTPLHPEGSDPAVRAEQRGWARSLTMPRMLEAAKSDPALSRAIVEGGQAMSGLAPDVFDRLRRDMAIGQLAEKLARAHDFQTQPTADDPIAGKRDFDAARKAAAERLDRLDDERELLGRVPALLSSVVNAVALMTDESRQAAFERLTA